MRRLRSLADKLRHLRIIQKLIIGYFLLICIPFAIFGYLFYTRMNDNLKDQYRSDQAQFAEQALSNFEIELSKVESAYSLFQNNTKLTEYLADFYKTDWEMIYTYLGEIRPTFSFSYLSNPIIENIRVFKKDTKALQLEPDILNMDAFEDKKNEQAVLALPPNRGLWTYDASAQDALPVIHYTHKLYNDSYSRELGLLRITANEKLINTLFQTLYKEKSWKWLLDAQGKPLYTQPVPEWDSDLMQAFETSGQGDGVKSFYVQNSRFLVNMITLKKLGITLVDISEMGPAANMRPLQGWLIPGGISLLVILSLIYFMVASSITLRIIQFSRHLKRVPELKLATFPKKSGTDEIGFLINSYNAMILRMEEMGERVHRTELLKKEAEIKMLQAQIKPHFLYNTLETMRMMAVMKNDQEIAEVAFTLAKLIRYSLAKSGDEITLQQEIDNVADYIAIHQVRMGERLKFELTLDGDFSSFSCPRFILQPIVENSILHGLGKLRRKGLISLSIRDFPDHVCIEIYNNGAAIPPGRLREVREMIHGGQETRTVESGIGLVNVQERLKAFYGGDSGITVQSEEGKGTFFMLRLEKGEGGLTDAETASGRR